ncbi:MAG: TetR/AcrR family transcriptional regulator [Candidatus Pristimantibacillus sp.]
MRKSTKGADSEKRILDAALALFAEHGYGDTKISDIVKAAGLTQAAFYLYFPSKEAIFQEILERFYIKLEKLLQAAAVPSELKSEDFPRRVRSNIESVLVLFYENPKVTTIFLAEERNTEDVERLIHQTIVSNLVHNRASGFVRRDLSPELIVNAMIGMFIQIALKELIDKQRPPSEVAREFTELLLYGLAQNRLDTGDSA